MQRITSFKSEVPSKYLSSKIVTKSTRLQKTSKSKISNLMNFIDGYGLWLPMENFGNNAPLVLFLRQYISSNNLYQLAWSKILLFYMKEGNPHFPFEDDEVLELLQICNEQTALKRLLQFIHKTTKA